MPNAHPANTRNRAIPEIGAVSWRGYRRHEAASWRPLRAVGAVEIMLTAVLGHRPHVHNFVGVLGESQDVESRFVAEHLLSEFGLDTATPSPVAQPLIVLLRSCSSDPTDWGVPVRS